MFSFFLCSILCSYLCDAGTLFARMHAAREGVPTRHEGIREGLAFVNPLCAF